MAVGRDIGLALDIRLNGDAFEIAGELRNSAQGMGRLRFHRPRLNGIQADLSATTADARRIRQNNAPPTVPIKFETMGRDRRSLRAVISLSQPIGVNAVVRFRRPARRPVPRVP